MNPINERVSSAGDGDDAGGEQVGPADVLGSCVLAEVVCEADSRLNTAPPPRESAGPFPSQSGSLEVKGLAPSLHRLPGTHGLFSLQPEVTRYPSCG